MIIHNQHNSLLIMSDPNLEFQVDRVNGIKMGCKGSEDT